MTEQEIRHMDAAGLEACATEMLRLHGRPHIVLSLFLDVLPRMFPGISLEYHVFPTGHRRAVASGRDFSFSACTDHDDERTMLLRICCLVANYFDAK